VLLGSVATMVDAWTSMPLLYRLGLNVQTEDQKDSRHLVPALLLCVSLVLESSLHVRRWWIRRASRRLDTTAKGSKSLRLMEGGNACSRCRCSQQRLLPLLPLLSPVPVMFCLMFVVESCDRLQHFLGIVPRTKGGLLGIPFSFFIHLSWRHFYWNVLGYLLLGLCVLCTPGTEHHCHADGHANSSSVRNFIAASVFIALTSGLLVWCLARPATHAGASGVIFGYAGYLLAKLLRRRDVPLSSLLVVFGVVSSFGSGVLLTPNSSIGLQLGPALYSACTSKTYSAEHHTFGFLSGLLFACLDGGWLAGRWQCRLLGCRGGSHQPRCSA